MRKVSEFSRNIFKFRPQNHLRKREIHWTIKRGLMFAPASSSGFVNIQTTLKKRERERCKLIKCKYDQGGELETCLAFWLL